MPAEKESIRLGILISGTGSTMEAIGKASQKGGMLEGKVKPVLVISSKPDAEGILKAKNLNIPVHVIERKQFEKGPSGTEQFGWVMIELFRRYSVEKVSQNGWLRYTPLEVIHEYENNIFNQHPGPTEFGGKGMHGIAVHAAVLEFQRSTDRVFPTEATIHRVSRVVDGGAVVAKQEVPVFPGDTPESLADRVLPVEHSLQIKFWEKVYQGNITELYRSEPLVRLGEEPLLAKAIQQGIIYARDQNTNV